MTLLAEFEKLALAAHEFHPGEWKDCKFTFCRERWVMFQTSLPVASAVGLSFNDAVRIARGCTDYGGGHRSDGMMDAYQHGIQTVINALEAAERNGLEDSQIAVLHHIGK